MKQIGWVVIDTKTDVVEGFWDLYDEEHAREYCGTGSSFEVHECYVDYTE